MPYRTLDPDRIVATLVKLNARIDQHFPDAGLSKVCAGLTDVARLTKERAARIAEPDMRIRFGSIAVVVLAVVLVAYLTSIIEYKHGTDNLFGVMQGIEALMNVLIAGGVAIFFLTTLESRWNRRRALEHLHELRTIVHVIDMHQLTKDPSNVGGGEINETGEPARVMTSFELLRYLDFCSELLSLSAKVATLYAQSSRDSLVISTVTELEQVSSNLSYKIWQKITLVKDGETVNVPAAMSLRGPSAA